MTDQELRGRISDYITGEIASTPPEGGLAPDFPLIEGGLVDSLGLFKLIAYMEDELGVTVAPEEILFENFSTVNAILELIQAKGGPAKAAG